MYISHKPRSPYDTRTYRNCEIAEPDHLTSLKICNVLVDMSVGALGCWTMLTTPEPDRRQFPTQASWGKQTSKYSFVSASSFSFTLHDIPCSAHLDNVHHEVRVCADAGRRRRDSFRPSATSAGCSQRPGPSAAGKVLDRDPTWKDKMDYGGREMGS